MTPENQRHAEVVRENDALILDRLHAMLHELPRREREAVEAGMSFKAEADELRSALGAIANADGSWDVVAYARDILDGAYEEDEARYRLNPHVVAVTLKQLAENLDDARLPERTS